ncbi:MAG: hypothetical protein ACKVPX_01730 [Myxococcaceae bacterium]
MIRSLLLLMASAVVASSCASHTRLQPEERGHAERLLTGARGPRFLRLSYYVMPFFGDATKRLLSALPPEEVRLLNHPNGTAVVPSPIQRILPAGTKIRVADVEFPTGFAVQRRVPYTPRTRTWVTLHVEGEPAEPALVLVLRDSLKSVDDVLAEVERYLSAESPSTQLEAYGAGTREAIAGKRLMSDMPIDALERAWGYPERKDIRYKEGVREETWLYPGGKRSVFVADGRVVRWEG